MAEDREQIEAGEERTGGPVPRSSEISPAPAEGAGTDSADALATSPRQPLLPHESAAQKADDGSGEIPRSDRNWTALFSQGESVEQADVVLANWSLSKYFNILKYWV